MRERGVVKLQTWLAVILAGALAGCRIATPSARAPGGPEGEAVEEPRLAGDLARRPLYTFSEGELDRYLRGPGAAEPDLIRRAIHLGRKNIGQPYECYLLGEFPFELIDPDPIYCLSRSDCLTFCEHSYAMALSQDWWSFLGVLQRIRYRDGIIGMLTRNHFTIADWNRNNSFLFEDLTARLGGGRAAVPLRQICRRQRFFARYGIGQDIPDEPINDRYIPRDQVPSILQELRDADFVNIIRGDGASQWAGHTGMIALSEDGAVNLLHSARPVVREEPLVDYLAGDSRCVGIKILRLRPGAETIMSEALASSPQATEVSASSLAQALAQRRESAPATAKPPNLNWKQATRLQSHRLDHDTSVDVELQAAQEEIDPCLAEQFAAAAAAIDDHLCGPPAGKFHIHQHVMHHTAEDFREGTVRGGRILVDPPGMVLSCPAPLKGADDATATMYESPVIATDTLFNEVLISWNVDTPPSIGFCVEARVGRRRDDSWSPYLYFADWGSAVPSGAKKVECEQGGIDVDYFRSRERFDRVQYRLRAVAHALTGGGGQHGAKLRIARVALCLSDTTGRATSVPRSARQPQPDASRWQRRLPVPFRSQRCERREIAGRICSPTAVAMVLEYRGVTRPTAEVARRSFDATHDIYGNWPRAVQAAYSYGIPGYLARFSDWTEVERMIAQGQPLILSVRADEGELSGAPYETTEGHLLVLTGFDPDGNVYVNDPASLTPERGQVTYRRRDLETVWMEAKGGTAYVLLPPRVVPPPVPPRDPASEPFVDVSDIDPRIVVDLRYVTTNNFTQQRLYPVARCLLRQSVARRLKRVQDHLVRRGLGLKIYDGYRPLSAQRKMWEIVPDPRYVADPAKGSRHNRGAAVDVTLVDAQGRELEMPTGFDNFTPAAHRNYAGGSAVSRRNRQVLAEAMAAEGFTGLSTEWWHFDAPGWRQYPLADVSLTDAP